MTWACWVTIVPAVIALWGLFNRRWDVVLLAAGLYLLFCIVMKRSLGRPCKGRLRSVPMPAEGVILPSSDLPVSSSQVFRAEGGGTSNGCA